MLFVHGEYCRSKNLTGCSPLNSPLCGNLNTAGATISGIPLLQRAVELRRSLIFLLSSGATSHGNSSLERSSCGLFPLSVANWPKFRPQNTKVAQ
jgi:hypothetical protein